jgi:hypothetical protein
MPVVNAIPADYPRVCPYLSVIGAADAIDFYAKVFGAQERMRLAGPDGKLGHAELQIGDSVVMLADEYPGMGGQSPKTLGGTPVTLTIYVEDGDQVFARALQAPPRSAPSRTSSTAIGRACSTTPSGTAGMSRRTSRTWRRPRWRSEPRRP